MSHPCDRGSDAAAYALGALDEHELAGFRRHLATCTVCQAEVDGFQQLANVLPLSTPQHPVSRQLRRRVINAVRDDAVERVRAAPRATREPFRLVRPAWWAAPGARGPARPGFVGLAAAVALVVVVVIVGLTAGNAHRRSGGAGSEIYSASTGSAEIVVSNGKGQLIVHHLAPLPKSQTYEVWYELRGSTPMAAPALFNVSPSGDTAVNLPGSLRGVSTVMVTRERAGGALTTHHKPVIVDKIS